MYNFVYHAKKKQGCFRFSFMLSQFFSLTSPLFLKNVLNLKEAQTKQEATA